MKTSRILRIRYLAVVALALSLTLASAGSTVPAALGYAGGPAGMAGPGTAVATARLLPDDGDGVRRDKAPLSPESVGEAALASNGSTWTVCASGCDYTTIQAAIDAASDGDTISIAAGTYHEHVIVNESLTLQGSTTGDTIVDGSNSGRVFTIEGGNTVTLENLTITNGWAGGGGGIDNSGTLTLNNSTVSNNSALFIGGIHNSGTLTLNNSTVSNNFADDLVGGIDNSGTLTLNNSTVSNNSAAHIHGGIDNSGTLILNDSTVSGNSAPELGGINNSGTMTVTNSTVSNNTSSAASPWGKGGGIYNEGSGTVTLSNSTLSGNSAGDSGGGIENYGTVTLTNSTLSDNSASDKGGGIYNSDGGTVDVSNSNLSGNKAVGAVGGGSGGAIFSWGALTFNNSTLSGNEASLFGGGIYNAGGTVTVSNSTLSGNVSHWYGGGIYNSNAGTVAVSNSTVSGNEADSNGGGIYNNNGTLTLNNSTVNGNEADHRGGGIYDPAYGLLPPRVKNTIIANNVALAYPSHSNCFLGVFLGVDSQGHNLDSGDRCGFDQGTDLINTDPLLGPLQDNGGPTFTQALLEGSPAIDAGYCNDIDGNPVLTDQRGMPRPQGSGCDIGAFEWPLRTDVITVEITDDEFGENAADCSLREAIQVANTDDFFGGCPIAANSIIILPAGTYELTIAGTDEDDNVTGDLDILGDLTINGAGADTTVIDAQGLDRVLHVHSGRTIAMNNVTITGGQTLPGGNGGGIHNNGSLTLDKSTVWDNATGSGGVGGGIYNDGELTVKSSTIWDNTSATGGGIATGSTVTIINSTISSNEATEGGGIHSSGGNTSIQFTTIVSNTGSSSGANVQNDGGSVELFATIIADPQPQGASNCGGAGLTSAGGYNQISDLSCDLQNISAEDRQDVTIELAPLANNGGPTLTHKPAPRETVVDIMPRSVCEGPFQNLGLDPKDQRGKPRPAWGIRQEGVIVVEDEWKCDAGAVELGAEEHYVCGPPLLMGWDGGEPDFGEFGFRCTHTTVHDALQEARTGDTVVVSGVVTETVTVSKTVTIRGPAIEESTPGTHMGIVQAALDAPDGDQSPGSVFTIIAGPLVTIEHLNIRHGDAVQGGGINNAGVLTLEGVSIYASHAITGGAVYNSGTLSVTNSTIVSNTASSGAGIYSASTATVMHVTLADNDGSNIHNGGTAGSVVVSGTILSTPSSGGSQCSGEAVTSDGYNLVDGAYCFTATDLSDPIADNVTGDPMLGPLRDNGGPTLTRAISADSAAVEAGPLEVDCAVETDQRGKARPFDMPGGGGARCDIGAVEYGPDTLTVCENCDPDPQELRFNDLQEALDRAMADDTIAVEAGAYTGNFIAYKDVTLQHAGIDVATLSQDQPVDVRAILQASERTIREQHRVLTVTQASGLSGTVLTVQAYYPVTSTGTIAVTGDVTVTLTGLTMRHGLSRQGGGVYNVGHLTIIKSTISENAAVNELQEGITVTVEAQGGAIYNIGQLTLERSTISGNRSEFYGGAIYIEGSASQEASVDVVASTIANNKAEKLPRQHVINITDAGFDPSAPTVDSGDEIQFQDRTAEQHWLVVPKGQGCTPEGLIEVPRMGAGLSEPLICSVKEGQDQVIVTVSDSEDSALSIQIEVNALSFTPQAHAIYATGSSAVTVARSIVVHSAGSGANCMALGLAIGSGKYNLVSDSTCNLTDDTDLRPGQEGYGGVELGPLQDNNAIDFEQNTISGYTYSHALKPGSSAIDWIPTVACGAASQHTITIASGNLDLTIETGDIVQWTNTADSTVALHDGAADVNLIAVPANENSREVQFAEPGSYPYRVYDNDSQAEIAHGTIEVESRTREMDQRGTQLPQRGTHDGTYNCDVGAYEFQPWIVAQPLPRPPAAVGTQPPRWNVGGEENTENVQSYHAASPGTAQDYALRPSPDDGDAYLEDEEIVTIYWETDPDPASQVEIAQYGIIEWPDDPQIHVSGAGVNLLHDGISDGFQVSGAQAFEGLEKEDVTVLTSGVFSRTVSSEDSYSVLQFAKGHQTNVTLKVQVVRTVGWNTPGVRDMRAERAVCEISSEIRYRAFEDDAGDLPGHEDPEGKAGQILDGDAFDGVHTEGDLATAQNTVDDLVPPAHIQNTREGPIIPILNTAPTFTDSNLVNGGHDLRVAWYRPDERNVAWPVKTVGYRCEWPADPPEIVIASELGSEIGGQAILSPDGFSDVTVYHQTHPAQPGFNPNDEHALLAASNLGNAAPALYALRTDLWDPKDKENTSEPYALLKYRDPREEDQIKIQVYKVVLTREAEEITDITPDPGTITLLASASAAAAGNPQSAIRNLQPNVTVRVGSGELPPGGDVTVPVEALGARDLMSATIKVSYGPTKLTPTRCATNRLDFVEALYNLQVSTDEPQQPFRTMHMRASLDAGTDAQYEWDFGDGTTRIAGAEVSHVYGDPDPNTPDVTEPYTYTIVVTATNGLFDPLTATTQVYVAEGEIPGSLADDETTGCRIETEGGLTLELKSRNKHGLSGNLLPTELTFETVGDPPATDTITDLDLTSITLFGPGYEELKFNITAGNPVYAPTPLRGLLDTQPCEQTQAKDPEKAEPFWKDFKDMLWARSAGEMRVLYFYPLQPGFYLNDDHAKSLGLIDEDGELLPQDQWVGQCIPWMDKLEDVPTETVGQLVPRTITTDADGARSVYAADVDGDGDLDVLSASFDDDKIAWYENIFGDGAFGPGQDIATDADGARSVYAADVDGDGDLDVLSASENDDKIAWYENRGGEGFAWAEHIISTDADGAQSVYAEDVDKDGDVDVLSASFDDDKIAWYENDGTPANGGWIEHIIVGIPDGNLALLLPFDEPAGATQFDDKSGHGRNASCSSPSCPTAGIDGARGKALQFDGADDYVEVPHSDGLNPDTGLTLAAWVKLADPIPAQVIIAKSALLDGYVLVVEGGKMSATAVGGQWGTIPADTWTHLAVTWQGVQVIGYVNGQEVGTSTLLIGSNTSPLRIGAASWDAGQGLVEGLIDHVVVYNRALSDVEIKAIYAGASDGASSVYAVDVDDDGYLDVVSASANDDKIAWYESDGTPADGGWTAHVISTDADGAQSVYAEDVDKDGDMDVLSASANDDKIAWYENTDGNGTAWTAHTLSSSAGGATSVHAVDVDGDGDVDVLSASFRDDKIAWYENDGTPAEGGWPVHTVSTDANGATSVYAGDVDDNGYFDILSASENDDKIAWYQNQNVQVLPVIYHADWPDLPPLLSVGETVYERAKSGISGVANQLAVSRIYDDLAPGTWDNAAKRIVIEGAEVQRSLVQLIDPIGEVRMELPITINDNPSLPQEIKTERLLFGGGQAIVGNKNDPDRALPFSLRSRITFDDIEGELVFRGYYDGTSPEYIKGDPLLLLNVMSLSDKDRLESLCTLSADDDNDGTPDCDEYRQAIEKLYHKTRNPRELRLCRKADGGLWPDGPAMENLEPDPNGDEVEECKDKADKPLDPQAWRRKQDKNPDQDFLIGVQDADDNGIPEPYEGLGKGKALTAGNAAGTGYITVAYNNDPSLGGLPVSLQVIKVGCTKNHLGEDSTYRGNLLVVQSDNLFDEKLTLRHTGDFGGRPDNFEFEWYIAEVDDTGVSPSVVPPNYPWRKWTRVEPGADAIGPEITIEGANPTTLSDNWLIMRYKNYPCCGNNYRWSNFAGDPSAKPSEVRGQLAEGWIKRVVGALNPFDTRVDDFVSAPVNTTVDMVRQAGPRYEGPIALSNDPEVLNQIGLIEAYQTVLDRGRDLSIDSSINHQGANAALLNVTSRIADLYMLLGNDAYMDALDPTVGLGTSSALASRAPVIFSFMNQFRSDSFGLIDEELGLLRGRDETLGGVAAAPTYNRLTWNFTNGEGEVAYVLNYNIKDMNQDGFVNEADAAIMYPQGHGDAWGHHLTAIKKYYELLRHPHYTWVPRAEPIGVAGAPVVVDYYDERRFAISAAAKARMGAEIVDLTYRKHYSDPDSQEYVDSQVDPSDDRKRAWGVADWARRAGQGAYFDWVMANAVLPPEDDRYTDVRKIDRTTVLEIGEVSDQYRQIQGQLDDADGGLNPLGLAQGAVLFDLDPALIAAGETHFEQVYERAIASLGNTLVLFDYANEMKLAQRESEDARRDFVTTIIEKDTALMNELIEIFGYPYDADIGVNGTYPEGYDGPDIYNYDLWDRTALTDHEKRCSDEDRQAGNCAPETTTYTIEHGPLECLGLFPKQYRLSIAYGELCSDVNLADDESDKLEIQYTVGIGLDKGRGRFKPSSWPEDSARKAPGDIQNALQALNQSRLQYEMAIRAYQNHVKKIDGTQKKIQERAIYLETIRGLKHSERWAVWAIDQTVHGLKLVAKIVKDLGTTGYEMADAAKDCPPKALGLAPDATSVVRCTINIGGKTVSKLAKGIAGVLEGVVEALGFVKDTTKAGFQTAILEVSQDYDLRQFGKQMGGLLREEKQLRLALYLAEDRVNGAQGDYDAAVQKGFRKLNELIRLRKRWAGQVSEQRYSDMAYRIFQNDALQKYRQQFDLAQQYTYLTAAAYDYETNLSRDDPAMGNQFLRQIVGLRTLGEVRRMYPLPLEPIVGSGGLADPLGRMNDNFEVLKGQMGFNNPQSQASRFSLRHELLRLRDDSDAKWRHELHRYYTPNIYNHDAVARLAKRPYGETGPQPGLVIPFGTNVTLGLNFFGHLLGPGDGAYNPTQFVTKIASVGVWFEGYDIERLARMPYVYLLPGGKDVIRPRDTSGLLRYWNIVEQLLPVPYPIGQAELEDPGWIPRIDGLDGQLFAIKPYASFQAFPHSEELEPDELNTDTRLIGRSVWNTEWVLVIPGSTLLADPQVGIERFIQDVDDVYIYFQTYAYAGN